MKLPSSILKGLALTEKSNKLGETLNQYVFRVDPGANKIEIKQAVERLFKVKVESVRTLTRAGKKKRERRMTYGRTSSSKRAYVTLKAGDKIDVVA